MRGSVRLVLSLLILATQGADAQPKVTESEEPELLEAAVRWGLSWREVAAAKIVFLGFLSGDPPEAFLDRLGVARVRRVSECPRENIDGKSLPVPPGGAIILTVGRIDLRTKSQASVMVSYYRSYMNGMECEELFDRNNGQWKHRPARSDQSRPCAVS